MAAFSPEPPDRIHEVSAKFKLDRPFFLYYVARLEHPGKNHVRLITAFERFKESTKSDWLLALGGVIGMAPKSFTNEFPIPLSETIFARSDLFRTQNYPLCTREQPVLFILPCLKVSACRRPKRWLVGARLFARLAVLSGKWWALRL